MSRIENGSGVDHRLCHIIKRDDFDGYGFNLHSEKGKPGQYIGKVDDNSPAEYAGLRNGDRIIEVNGVNIGNETHKQVVQRIKAISSEVRLLVIDPNQEKIQITSSTDVTNNQNNDLIDNTINNNTKQMSFDDKIDSVTGSVSPTVSIKSETNSASCSNINNNNNNINNNKNNNNSKLFDKTDINDFDKQSKNQPVTAATPSDDVNQSSTVSTSTSGTIVQQLPSSTSPSPSTSSTGELNHQNGTTITSGTISRPSGLNLPMTAAEMRAKLLAKKKYDPKNDTVDLRKKFEIIQKL